MKDKKNRLSEEELIKINREKTAQQWIPIADINDSIVYKKNGSLLCFLRIKPVNIDLLSDSEKRRKIEAFAEQINGETNGFQIFCIGRPVDLNSYIEWLENKRKAEQNKSKKNLLKHYLQYVSNVASSGEVTERRFYIILSQKNNIKNAKDELLSRANLLKSKLLQAELESYICGDDDILDLFSLFAYPNQASFEKEELTRFEFAPLFV